MQATEQQCCMLRSGSLCLRAARSGSWCPWAAPVSQTKSWRVLLWHLVTGGGGIELLLPALGDSVSSHSFLLILCILLLLLATESFNCKWSTDAIASIDHHLGEGGKEKVTENKTLNHCIRAQTLWIWFLMAGTFGGEIRERNIRVK